MYMMPDTLCCTRSNARRFYRADSLEAVAKALCRYRNNVMKDENGDLLADSNTIVNRWKS
jgi:hypothetical protein